MRNLVIALAVSLLAAVSAFTGTAQAKSAQAGVMTDISSARYGYYHHYYRHRAYHRHYYHRYYRRGY
jgi:hypothetical protein